MNRRQAGITAVASGDPINKQRNEEVRNAELKSEIESWILLYEKLQDAVRYEKLQDAVSEAIEKTGYPDQPEMELIGAVGWMADEIIRLRGEKTQWAEEEGYVLAVSGETSDPFLRRLEG